MTACIIVDIWVTDPARYEEYKKLDAPTVELYRGKYIARGTRSLRHETTISNMVVVEGI